MLSRWVIAFLSRSKPLLVSWLQSPSTEILEPPREFQKNIYFCFIDYAKAFDCVDHNKLWKILKVMGIPDHLICLLRNLKEICPGISLEGMMLKLKLQYLAT